MVDIYINPATHDIDLTNGRSRTTQGVAEEIRQKLAITLRTFKGEWFKNVSFGVPWLQNKNNDVQIIGKSAIAIADIYIREAIMSVQGVTRISLYTSNLNRQTREFKVSFEVKVEREEGVATIPFEESFTI